MNNTNIAVRSTPKQYAVRAAKTWRCRWLKNQSVLNRQILVAQTRSNFLDPHYVMNPVDREAFAKLPDTFTVYRGFNPVLGGTADGVSWATARIIAELFAGGFGTHVNGKQISGIDGGQVVERTVNKRDVFTYFYVEGEVVLHSGEADA